MVSEEKTGKRLKYLVVTLLPAAKLWRKSKTEI